ncbi:MAG: hypothetical protein SF187_05810 [Deltaproteobacteria bacterium]|nr:hypothetical protein [Deltaproteobacteria bacterium]
MAHPDFEEFLVSLNEERVRYLIGGAHALAFHARPRATKDLDVFIDPSRANAERTVRAIGKFFGGTSPKFASAEYLRNPDTIVQLGVAPVRIDIVSSFGSIKRFADAWTRRVTSRFGTVDAHYLSLDDLIAEKTFWARPQDLADLVVLKRAVKQRGK